MTASPRKFQSYQELPAWGTAEAPPTEFLLFPYGKTQGTAFGDGGRFEEIYLTPENAQRIVDEYTRRQIKGCFDYNHELGESAGWYDIEARSDGLWLVNIEWTPDMYAKFKDRKWRYDSPYFMVEKGEDGRNYITELLNVAITNFPRTDNQRPLIALSQYKRFGTMDMDLEKIASAVTEYLKTVTLKTDNDKELAGLKITMMVLNGGKSTPADPAPEDAGAEGGMLPAEEMATIAATAREVTGKTKAIEVCRALYTMSVKQDRVATLTTATTKALSQQRKAKLDKAQAAMLITPARRKQIEGWMASGRYDDAMLDEDLAGAVPQIDTREIEPPEATPAAPSTPKTLTPAELIKNPDFQRFARKRGFDDKASLAWAENYLRFSKGAAFVAPDTLR